LQRTDVLMLAVPSESMNRAIGWLAPRLTPKTVVVSGSKGLADVPDPAGEGHPRPRRMTEIIARYVSGQLCALSGPNLAKEVAGGLPATTVVASSDAGAAAAVQRLFAGPTFRVYTSTDVVGVELGGALKNVVALAAGVADGMHVGDNAKAALITRGLAEMSRLGQALGADARTFAGLAGLGDLVATCASPFSRNRRLGEQVAGGKSLDQAQRTVGQLAEGVPTTLAAVELADQAGVEMPIFRQMHALLFEGKDPRQAVLDLMQREPKSE